jgi:hypothetical protein
MVVQEGSPVRGCVGTSVVGCGGGVNAYEPAEFPTGVKAVLTLLVKSNTPGKAVSQTAKAREPASMPLVTRTPMALAIDRRDFINRVCADVTAIPRRGRRAERN